MGLLTHLFGRFSQTAEPWTTESAYQAIRSRIDPASGRIASDVCPLPDEDAVNAGNKIRWAPGAMDGVFGHHADDDDSKATVARLARLVDEVARTGDRRAGTAAYAMMKDDAALSLVDPLIELLGERGTPIEPHLSRFAWRLATESADRGSVKVGIALLEAPQSSRNIVKLSRR